MEKLFYEEPRMRLLYVSSREILCGSPGAGESEGTGEEPLFP